MQDQAFALAWQIGEHNAIKRSEKRSKGAGNRDSQLAVRIGNTGAVLGEARDQARARPHVAQDIADDDDRRRRMRQAQAALRRAVLRQNPRE